MTETAAKLIAWGSTGRAEFHHGSNESRRMTAADARLLPCRRVRQWRPRPSSPYRRCSPRSAPGRPPLPPTRPPWPQHYAPHWSPGTPWFGAQQQRATPPPAQSPLGNRLSRPGGRSLVSPAAPVPQVLNPTQLAQRWRACCHSTGQQAEGGRTDGREREDQMSGSRGRKKSSGGNGHRHTAGRKGQWAPCTDDLVGEQHVCCTGAYYLSAQSPQQSVALANDSGTESAHPGCKAQQSPECSSSSSSRVQPPPPTTALECSPPR